MPRRIAIRLVLSLTVLCALLPGLARSGPHVGGTLILHYHDALTATCDPPPFQSALDNCDRAVVRVPPATAFPPDCSEYQVWYAYAAFPPGSLPRLRSICFGIDYNPLAGGTGIELVSTFRDPTAAEIQSIDPPWPDPRSGTALVFLEMHTERVVPIYAFVGYGSPGQVFSLKSHPDPKWGATFGDDSVPPNLDPVAGFGSIGFGICGERACPEPTIIEGGCCDPDGTCTYVPEAQCPSGDWVWGRLCDPNPCHATAAQTTAWGKIKQRYR